MTSAKFTRSVDTDGSVRLASRHGSFVFARPKPGVLFVTVTGHDNGDYGSATLDEILQFLKRERPLTLFVDTREAISVAPNVRTDWTSFLSSNRDQFGGVHVLTSSKAVHLSVAVAQHFSGTGNLIRLYSNPEIFAATLAKSGEGDWPQKSAKGAK